VALPHALAFGPSIGHSYASRFLPKNSPKGSNRLSSFEHHLEDVVGLDLIVIEKYLLIVLASFPIIVALLYPISKVNVLRFLFGMRMRRQSAQEQTSSIQGAP